MPINVVRTLRRLEQFSKTIKNISFIAWNVERFLGNAVVLLQYWLRVKVLANSMILINWIPVQLINSRLAFFCRDKRKASTLTKKRLRLRNPLSQHQQLDNAFLPAWRLSKYVWQTCLSTSWSYLTASYDSSSSSTACLCSLLPSL